MHFYYKINFQCIFMIKIISNAFLYNLQRILIWVYFYFQCNFIVKINFNVFL